MGGAAWWETEKSRDVGDLMHQRAGKGVFKSSEGGERLIGRSSEVGLYRLVASATLPPANQVRDKHKDD